MDEEKRRFKGFGFRAGRVGMPFAIRPRPEDMPNLLAAHIRHLGNPGFDELAGTLKSWTHVKKLNGLAREALSLANLFPQVQRRAAMHPKVLFEGYDVLGDFDVSEGHGCEKRPVDVQSSPRSSLVHSSVVFASMRSFQMP